MSDIKVSGDMVDECDVCHHVKLGAWYEDSDTGVEWFLCDECKGSQDASDKEWGDDE